MAETTRDPGATKTAAHAAPQPANPTSTSTDAAERQAWARAAAARGRQQEASAKAASLQGRKMQLPSQPTSNADAAAAERARHEAEKARREAQAAQEQAQQAEQQQQQQATQQAAQQQAAQQAQQQAAQQAQQAQAAQQAAQQAQQQAAQAQQRQAEARANAAATAANAQQDADALNREQLDKRVSRIVEADRKVREVGEPSLEQHAANGTMGAAERNAAQGRLDGVRREVTNRLENKAEQRKMTEHVEKAIDAAAARMASSTAFASSGRDSITDIMGSIRESAPNGMAIEHTKNGAQLRAFGQGYVGGAVSGAENDMARLMQRIPEKHLHGIPGYGKGNEAWDATVKFAILTKAYGMSMHSRYGRGDVPKSTWESIDRMAALGGASLKDSMRMMQIYGENLSDAHGVGRVAMSSRAAGMDHDLGLVAQRPAPSRAPMTNVGNPVGGPTGSGSSGRR